jgi:hypothetical protein
MDELRLWMDQQAITGLINRYSDAITRGDWDQLESVFTDNAVFDIAEPFAFHADGATGIRTGISEGCQRLEFLIHEVASIVIRDVTETSAHATSTATELSRGVAPGLDGEGDDVFLNFEHHVVYFDDLVKVDGEWKFARRYGQPLYLKDGAHTGETIADRHALIRTATYPPAP